MERQLKNTGKTCEKLEEFCDLRTFGSQMSGVILLVESWMWGISQGCYWKLFECCSEYNNIYFFFWKSEGAPVPQATATFRASRCHQRHRKRSNMFPGEAASGTSSPHGADNANPMVQEDSWPRGWRDCILRKVRISISWRSKRRDDEICGYEVETQEISIGSWSFWSLGCRTSFFWCLVARNVLGFYPRYRLFAAFPC